jgi:hypothetical protein
VPRVISRLSPNVLDSGAPGVHIRKTGVVASATRSFPSVQRIQHMRSLFAFGAAFGLALVFVSPALGQAQGEIGQIEVGDDTLELQVDRTEGLTNYVTARTRSGRLIRSPRLSFASLDTSIVRVSADTAYGVHPGTALVVVSPASGSRPVRDTLILVVNSGASLGAQAADSIKAYSDRPRATDTASATNTVPAADTAPAGSSIPVATAMAKLPPGTVLAPEPNPVPLLVSEREAVSPVVRRQGDNGVVGTVRSSWQSLSPGIVQVDSAGNVTGVGVGTGVVQVTPVGGASRTVSVTVDTARISFLQQHMAVPVGEQRTPRVLVPRQGNRFLDNLKLTWRSSNDSVAMVGADGTITGRSPGGAQIIATGFLRADTLPLTVHPVVSTLVAPRVARPVVVPLRSSVRFPVFGLGSGSDTVRGIPMTWVVGDRSVIAFDTAGQTISGLAVGTTRLTLRVEGFKPYTWTVSVIPPGIALDRDRLGLSMGSRQTLVANMVDASGRSVAPLRKGDWRSSDPGVATVNLAGEVEAKTVGRALISIAGPGGRSDTTEVFVGGDLLVTSNLGGKRPGIYLVSLARPDSLLPFLADSAAYLGAVYSPDRTRIAFATGREKSVAVWVTEADPMSTPRLVLRMPGSTASLAWMPDGGRLVFAVGMKEKATLGLLDLNAVSWDTLARVEGDPTPDVARDGTIAYAAGDKNRSDIYIIARGSKVVTRLTNSPIRKWSPRWLPDGDILFLVEDSREQERFRIIRYSPKTGNQAPLVKSKLPILSLAVAPDGGSIAYLAKGTKKNLPSSVVIRDLDPRGTVRELGLRPGETVTALSF